MDGEALRLAAIVTGALGVPQRLHYATKVQKVELGIEVTMVSWLGPGSLKHRRALRPADIVRKACGQAGE